MAGIIGWGAYVPYWRLERAAIGAALGTSGGKGTRSVASYDEDTTSLAVEAGRRALGANSVTSPDAVTFATTAPAYLDKTNATTIHAALALDPTVAAYDFLGSVRSAAGAFVAGWQAAAAGTRTLVTLADIRTGLPGGADERDGGDGAAALLIGDDAAAEVLATSHVSREFLDRWREVGADSSSRWEERFGETVYAPMAAAAVEACLKQAGVTPSDIDHVAVVGTHDRAVRRTREALGLRADVGVADFGAQLGNTGAASLGIALSDILDQAEPGQHALVVSLADGADAIVLRTTPALTTVQERNRECGVPTVRDQVAAGRSDLPYPTFLTWREMLRREPPRRPDPVAPTAPPALRRAQWKYGFFGTECTNCGSRHLPPARVCVGCRTADSMTEIRLADVRATVATFTIDRLAYTLSPPVVAAVIDFDGGGRFSCELTDLDPTEVHIGLRVEMTFRNLYSANGVRNYFWKAKPLRTLDQTGRNS